MSKEGKGCPDDSIRRRSIALYLFSCIVFTAWALIPASWATTRSRTSAEGFGYETITIISPAITLSLSRLAVATAAVLFVMIVCSLKWPMIRYPAIALLLVFGAFPFAGLVFLFHNLGSWTTHDRLTGADSRTYVFCDSSFLQGQTMALGRLETENGLFTRFRVLGTTNGDSPRSWAPVIRPAGARDEYGMLHESPDGVHLVGLRHHNHCYFAYDVPSQRFIGHGPIEKISPFICLRIDDEMHGPDIAAMRKQITTEALNTVGFPKREAVQSGLDHGNLRVRTLAAELLALMDARVPIAH